MKIEVIQGENEVTIRFAGKANMSQEVNLSKSTVSKLIDSLSKNENTDFETD